MKALNRDREDFGIIQGVTDKEWYTNSFHLNVKAEVTAIEKTNAEYEFYKYSSGGRIMYVEWPHTENLEAIEQYLSYAMEKGLYVGINFDNGTCNDCGAKGSFIDGYCTECNSTNVLVINRVCGYLGLAVSNGESRYNKGKEEEVKNRFKHFNVVKECCM